VVFELQILRVGWFTEAKYKTAESTEKTCSGVNPNQDTNRSETTETNCFETFRNFLKNQNMLSFKLFRVAFCLFRFNRNTESRCYRIEAKQPKQTFCFG
jgi:hypothetical protein